MLDPSAVLRWGAWVPLTGPFPPADVPASPGLYRIRRVGFDGIDYIGQTGSGTMTLPKRLAMLRGVYAPEMPYADPHTAGPALWALRHATGAALEASVAPVQGSTPWRKGVECLAIALYRQESGCSPTVNFGRMPAGYRKSSGNSARLVAMDKRFRGGLTTNPGVSHLPGVEPVGAPSADPIAQDWCGHEWAPWQPVPDAIAALPLAASGLYRLRTAGAAGLAYIGEGLIAARLGAHVLKAGVPSHPQAPIFARPGLEASYVINRAWLPHQRLELETDLIGAHVLYVEAPPAAQFLG